MDYCYMCDRPASSREHVPPRNLFPESKDVNGEHYRVNLITVPSCEFHNSAKSHDDEFLMVSLAGIIGNNSIGYRHKFGKVDRAIKRSSNRLLEKVFIKKKEIFVVEFESNKFLEVIWGTPDAQRLYKCFNHIVRGLYFHHFKISFSGDVKIHLGYLRSEDKSSENFCKFIRDKAELELADKERFGQNQTVFFYQISDKDGFGLFLFHLCFYGGLSIYASFIPEGVEVPVNLGIELMNRGMKTFINLNDESYEIN